MAKTRFLRGVLSQGKPIYLGACAARLTRPLAPLRIGTDRGYPIKRKPPGKRKAPTLQQLAGKEDKRSAQGANPCPRSISGPRHRRKKGGNMADLELNDLKPYLQDYAARVLTKSKGGLYNCPICGSGTGPNKDGALGIYDNGQRWKCQSIKCGQGGDIFDLYAAFNDCTLNEATKAIIALYGSAPQPPARNYLSQKSVEGKPIDTAKIDKFIYTCAGALEGSAGESYLQGRGFTLETMRRFKLGYSQDEYNKPLGKRLPSIVIPYPGASYYITRPINDKAYDKPKTSEAGSEPLYNAAALYGGAGAVFVVESQLCALSIKLAGGAAVALGNNGNNRLINQLKAKPTTAALIICLDNDEPGRKASAEMGAALEGLSCFAVNGTAAIMGDCTDKENPNYKKDPNEVLIKAGLDELKAAVYETEQETIAARSAANQAAQDEREQRTGPGMVDNFLQAIQTRKYEPMPTGISDIDKAIGGGFIREQLVLLGAAPGAGKTALAQWIFEGMARNGTTCVFLNLEMARDQVLARSISRIAAQQGATVKTTDVLQGYKWTDTQRAQIMRAAAAYRANIAPRMIYNPPDVTANLDSILEYIENEAKQAEAAGEKAPVCVLDYLQLVRGGDRDDAAAVIKRAVSELKNYAVRHKTLVFVIIAHNRESNKTGAATMEAGRDTSALEYSADLQLALTYTLCLKRNGEKRKSPEDLTEEEKKRVTLKITKGRFGGGGKSVDLLFNGETMTYTQIASDFLDDDDDIDGLRI